MSSCGMITRICYRTTNRLEKDTVLFTSLPIEVKEFFDTVSKMRPTELDEFFYNSENVPLTEKQIKYCNPYLFIFNTTYEYELKDVDRITGQIPSKMWISHFLLTDKTNNITYRFNYEDFTRLIIVYNRELFTPTKFNIYNDLYFNRVVYFVKYSLDSDRRYRRIWKKEEKRIKTKF